MFSSYNLYIPTALVSVLFCSSIPTSFFILYIYSGMNDINNIQYMYSHNINATAFSELIHYINYNNITFIQNAKHIKLDL